MAGNPWPGDRYRRKQSARVCARVRFEASGTPGGSADHSIALSHGVHHQAIRGDVALGVTPAPIRTRRSIESTLPTYQREGIEAALNQYRMLRKNPRAELYTF